jgi:hypothetical protein
MKDWKLTSLPQCSGPAATSTLPPKEEWGAASDALPVLPTAREICSTGVLSHDDPRLIRLLLSAVAKCAASPLHPVPVVSATRLYIALTAAEWRWVRMTPVTVSDFNARISSAQKKVTEPITEFTVLKSMIAGSDHNVWTVIAGQPPAVCVVKQTDATDDAQYEAEVWRTVNQSALRTAHRLRISPRWLCPSPSRPGRLDVSLGSPMVRTLGPPKVMRPSVLCPPTDSGDSYGSAEGSRARPVERSHRRSSGGRAMCSIRGTA